MTAFAIPETVREQLGNFDRTPVDMPDAAPVIRDTVYSVQIVRNLWEHKQGRKITHGRSVAHPYDSTRDPGTFCGKPWRHPELRYCFFDVVANVHRDEAIDRISCVACQVELS